jgi:putrescine aminotransferase
VRRRLRLDRPAGEVVARLHERPHLLDPFAGRPADAVPPGLDPEFAGTLGHDVVVWADRAGLGPDGVTSSAEPCWLWRRLDREVRVRPDGGGCVVEVSVDWDTGSGPYEGMLGGRIGYFVAHRLTELLEQLTITAPLDVRT